MSKATKGLVLGFLSVRGCGRDGLRGGYLLTSDYGRPLEFHHTTELRMGRVQRSLYGAQYEKLVLIDALAKPLIDRQGKAPCVVLVEDPGLLGLRKEIPAPVLLVRRSGASEPESSHTRETQVVVAHPEHPEDGLAFEKLRNRVPPNFSWVEPFDRLENALAELRDAPALAAA